MRKNRGRLFVVSAPSGAGKTTLCRAIVSKHSGVEFSVSHTTRRPREGEVDGRDYFFVDEIAFMKMVDEGGFLEWASVHGAHYGTSRAGVIEAIEKGTSIMLDIDVQGAKQIRESSLEAVFVFVLPPSREALLERLSDRGTDSEETIRRRMGNAASEIREYLWYDYVIINDVFDKALNELEAVVLASELGSETVDPAWVQRNFISLEEG